jgi:type I restriction enzyme M protein
VIQPDAQFSFTHNDLVGAIRDVEQILLANSGEDAFEEILKLIFAKLWDENPAVGRARESRFNEQGTAAEVCDRLNTLLREAINAWPGVFPPETRVLIAPDHIRFCIRPLTSVLVSGQQLSIIDAAFEHLLTRTAKGTMGQYFTPRHVIDLCVDAIGSHSASVVLDPACGSGGFLLHAWQKLAATRTKGTVEFIGYDLDSRATRIARILSLVEASGQICIERANSIDGREWSSVNPEKGWNSLDEIHADLILTNPPFAGRITDSAILANYKLSRDPSTRSSKGGVDRDILFVERCVRMLTEGGKMAIVVPQGVLANSNTRYVREWLFDNCTILAVVGLHPLTFIPHTGIKTSVLFLQKGKAAKNHGIFFATSSRPGKDSGGNLIYKPDGTVDHDLREISELLAGVLQSPRFALAEQEIGAHLRDHVSIQPITAVRDCGRLDAEYFAPKYLRVENLMQSKTQLKVSDCVSQKIARFKANAETDISYFDISSIDADTGFATPSLLSSEEAPSRAQYLVRPGDVLVSTVRPDRNSVTIVRETQALPVASSGLCVLRAQRIEPEYLFAFCKTQHFKSLLTRYVTASMYPAVSDADILNVPLLADDETLRKEVTGKVQEAFKKMDEARTSLRLAVSLVESALGDLGADSCQPDLVSASSDDLSD